MIEYNDFGLQIDEVHGVDNKSARYQAVCEKAADALDTTRGSSAMRIQVLAPNDDLHASFERWYPHPRQPQEAAAPHGTPPAFSCSPIWSIINPDRGSVYVRRSAHSPV